MFNSKLTRLLIKNLINFIVFAIPLVMWQPSFDPFGPTQLMVLRVFIPLLFFLFFIRGYISGKILLKKNPLNIALISYIIVCFISIFFSINKTISFKYFIELFLAIYGAYLCYSICDKEDVQRIIVLIIFSHTIMALYGIMQHFNADVFMWNTNFAGRPLSTIGNPDFFATELLIPIFILAAYFLFEKQYRPLSGTALLINLLCFYYTKVAGAYVGFACGTVIFILIIFIYKKDVIKVNRKKIVIGFLCLVFLSAIASPFIIKKVSSVYSLKKRSLVHRLLMWETSMLMIKDSPVIGKGIGNYRLYYPYYQGLVLASPQNKEFSYVVTWMPHQNYLLIAAETGFLGLGMFLLAIMVFYRIGWDIFVRKKAFSIPALGIISAITSILGTSFFNTFYNIPATTFLFFLLMYILYVFTDNKKMILIEKNKLQAPALIAALTIFYFCFQDAKTLASDHYLKKANSMAEKQNYAEAIGCYEKIIKLDPVELCPQMDIGQFYYLAEAYRNTGDLKEAEYYYRQDLKINPYCPEVNNMLGALCGQLGNLDDAVKYLKIAVFTAPHYDTAYKNLVTAYMAKKDFDAAEKALNSFLALNGSNTEIEKMLSIVDQMAKGQKNAK